MKFQVGDKVVVKHTNEEAEVIDIINNKMVMLEAGGVKFPAYTDQLEYPYFKRFTEKKLVPEKRPKTFVDDIKKEKQQYTERKEDGVSITFLPVLFTDEFGDDVVDYLKIHLLNRTNRAYKFDYIVSYFGKNEFELKNEVQPFENFYLHDVDFDNLSDNPVFSFDFSLVKPEKGKADHYEAAMKLKPKQLFAKLEELKQKGEATFSYKLFNHYPDKPPEQYFDPVPLAAKGYKLFEAKEARKHLEPAKHEVDLHIEKLTPDHATLSNFEKLTLQLKTFEKYLDLAIAHHQSSMIVVHGLGSGKLRDEIHEILRIRREIKSFINQYHPAYGYGATEIYFQY